MTRISDSRRPTPTTRLPKLKPVLLVATQLQLAVAALLLLHATQLQLAKWTLMQTLCTLVQHCATNHSPGRGRGWAGRCTWLLSWCAAGWWCVPAAMVVGNAGRGMPLNRLDGTQESPRSRN
jgi:hypothetical protein